MSMNNGGGFQLPRYMPEAAIPQIGMDALSTPTPGVGLPGLPGQSGMGGFGGLDLSQKIGMGLQGVGTVANLVLGLKQLSLANKQYGLQKRAFETNLTNQVRSYNDTMADRLRARAVMETGNTNGVDQQIKERSLTTGM